MEKRDILSDVIHPFFMELIGVYLKAYEKVDELSGVDRETALKAIKESSEIIMELVSKESIPENIYKAITVDLINLYARIAFFQGLQDKRNSE